MAQPSNHSHLAKIDAETWHSPRTLLILPSLMLRHENGNGNGELLDVGMVDVFFFTLPSLLMEWQLVLFSPAIAIE